MIFFDLQSATSSFFASLDKKNKLWRLGTTITKQGETNFDECEDFRLLDNIYLLLTMY